MEKKKYIYETHMHTSPVSRCGHVGVRESLEFYKEAGYDGVFITNHFLDGNNGVDRTLSYEDQIKYFFSDYESGIEMSDQIGIKVFCGAELSHHGTDFLVYGLDKDWYLEHGEIMQMRKKDELELMMNSGALVIQAHPFREANYIECIRLYPRQVHGVEIYNACRTDRENELAEQYARDYGLLPFSGSDNHNVKVQTKLGGMMFDSPLIDELDFVNRIKRGQGDLIKITVNKR